MIHTDENHYSDEYILSAALKFTEPADRISSTVSVRSLRWFILVQLEGKTHAFMDKCQSETGLTGGRISKVLIAHPELFTPVYRTPHVDPKGYVHNRVARFIRNTKPEHHNRWSENYQPILCNPCY